MTHKLLVFSRRMHVERTRALGAQLLPHSAIDVWSDERLPYREVRWWGRWFYEALSETHSKSEIDVDEMIKRCRFLRELQRETAERLAIASVLAWSRILRQFEYDLVLMLPIDSFVLDGLERAAKSQGIPAVFPVGTPFHRRFRFSCRGELMPLQGNDNLVSESSESEYSRLMGADYHPDFLIGVDKPAKRTALRRVSVDSVKPPLFAAYRWISGDTYSYSFCNRHYLEKRMFGTFRRFRASLDLERYAVARLPSEFVFIPLQFYPESTTDYWIPETAMINHHNVVLSIVEALEGSMAVVVKEHPAAIGRRSSRFIAKLLAKKNVAVLPANSPIPPILERATVVVGPGSTTLLQARLMGKSTVFTGTPFYGAGNMPVLKSLEDLAQIRSVIEAARRISGWGRAEGLSAIKEFMKATTSGNLGYYAPIGEKAVALGTEISVGDEGREFVQQLLTDR